eukprot:m51a1_g8227 hypothetical protein (289) ;mRNA; r:147506-158224
MTQPIQSTFTNANANANISEIPPKPELTDIELAAPGDLKAIDKAQPEPTLEYNAGHVSLRTHLLWMLALRFIPKCLKAHRIVLKAPLYLWVVKKQDKFYNGKYKGHVVKIQVVVNNQGIPMDVQELLGSRSMMKDLESIAKNWEMLTNEVMEAGIVYVLPSPADIDGIYCIVCRPLRNDHIAYQMNADFFTSRPYTTAMMIEHLHVDCTIRVVNSLEYGLAMAFNCDMHIICHGKQYAIFLFQYSIGLWETYPMALSELVPMFKRCYPVVVLDGKTPIIYHDPLPLPQ